MIIILYLCPLSAFRGLLFNDPDGVSFAALKDDFTPYKISNRPSSGSKDLMGNRDCQHRQFHGIVYVNDMNYPTSSYLNGVWSRYWGCNQTINIKMYNGNIFRLCRAVYPGFTIDELHFLYYPDYDYSSVPYIRFASMEANHGVYFEIQTSSFCRWSGISTETGYEIRIEYKCAQYNPKGDDWYPCYVYDLDLTWNVTLPKGCSWRRRTHLPSSSGKYYAGYTTIQIKADTAVLKREEFFFIELVKDMAEKIKNHLLSSVPNYTASHRWSDVYWSNSGVNYLKKSYFPKIREELTRISLVNEPIADKTLLVSRATQSAADAARDFTGNTGTLIRELLQLKSSLTDLYKLLRGQVNLKGVSSLYLSGKYGLRLTVQDTMDLAHSIYKQIVEVAGLYSVARGSATADGITCRCKLYYDQNTASDFAQAMFNLQSWDLFPSFQNVWDIIPYSFVLDWFIDIEGFLSAIDTRTFMSTMNIFRVLYSIKKEWKCKEGMLDKLGLVGSVSFSSYERWSESEPWPVIPTFSGKDPSSHIVEGSALILQRL